MKDNGKSKSNPKVDWFFEKDTPWREVYAKLRDVALGCGLTEELKWGNACYTLGGKNIVLIHGFKEYCAFLFFKGALMKDPDGILIQQTENVQAARQIRFTGLADVKKRQTALKGYINEAIAVEKAGLKVTMKSAGEFAVPEEFAKTLKANAALSKAFKALTPGRQRAYLLHFSSAKQTQTRLARIEKCGPLILAGKGLTD